MTLMKLMDQKRHSAVFQKKNLFIFAIIVFTFFLDRVSKIKILNLQINNETIFVNDYLNLNLVWNTGIGFGLLSSDSTIFYNIITLIIGFVIFFLAIWITKSNTTEKFFLSLILGGALGNIYDRIIYFAVPDFIDFHYKTFHWFTFNIADIFITIGILLIIFKDLFLKNVKNL